MNSGKKVVVHCQGKSCSAKLSLPAGCSGYVCCAKCGTRAFCSTVGEREVVDTVFGLIHPNGKIALIRAKLKSGAWIEASGFTPLMMESIHKGLADNSIPFVDIEILTGHADEHQYTGDLSPLHTAAELGDAPKVRQLLESGVNPDSRSGLKEFTAIALAARVGNAQVVRILLEYGADPNIPSHVGGFPIHAAAASGHVEALQALADGGASVRALNGSGRSAIEIAHAKGHAAMIVTLKRLDA